MAGSMAYTPKLEVPTHTNPLLQTNSFRIWLTGIASKAFTPSSNRFWPLAVVHLNTPRLCVPIHRLPNRSAATCLTVLFFIMAGLCAVTVCVVWFSAYMPGWAPIQIVLLSGDKHMLHTHGVAFSSIPRIFSGNMR